MNTNVFSAYDYGGNVIALPASSANLPNIKNIGISLTVRATKPDIKTGIYPTIAMASEARINN
jgi:hypothetical protein